MMMTMSVITCRCPNMAVKEAEENDIMDDDDDDDDVCYYVQVS